MIHVLMSGVCMNSATILSAVAAALAAVFAGLNLYLSGRREHVHWARDALVDTFVDFLTASYDHKFACRRLLRAAREPGTAGVSPALLEQAQQAHDQMMRCVSRLRMLTTEEVVEAALRLHEYNDLHYELATRPGEPPSCEEEREALLPFDADRDRLVRAAKRVLSIT